MNIQQQNIKKAALFLTNVRSCLNETYGEVPSEYEISLQMLEHNLLIFFESEDYIRENGMVVEDFRGMPAPNPMIKISLQSQQSCNKILDSFGLQPLSKAKLKKLNQDDQDESCPIDDFIS